jgi:transcriptional regulatory protein GAL4
MTLSKRFPCLHVGIPLIKRSYLTEVEKRLHGLETLVSQLLPGVNIDDVLSSPEHLRTASSALNTRTPESAQPLAALSPQGSTSSAANEPILPEAVPNSVDGFNWQEENVTVDGLTDGMAALSVEPTGVGYLGSLSLDDAAINS